MTIKNAILTLVAAGSLAGGAAAGEPADRAPGPVRTAVVAQVPEACAPSPAGRLAATATATATESSRAAAATAESGRAAAATAESRRAAAATRKLRAAAPPGARVLLVCSPSEAQAAVVRVTAEGYDDVLWSGAGPRAAAGLVAPDHPATRYAPLEP